MTAVALPIIEGNYIPKIPDIWKKIYFYLKPIDIVILGTACRIFRIIAASPFVWREIGKDTFCFIRENDDPRNVVYQVLNKAHRAGMEYFSFRHEEVHFFKRHCLLIESIKDVAQEHFHCSQSNPDLLRLLLQAGARPSPDHYKGCLTPQKHFESYQLCLEAGALPSRLLLWSMIDTFSVDHVRYVVEKGVKPDLEIIKKCLGCKVSPAMLDYLIEQLGDLTEFDIVMALDDGFPLDILKRMASKVKVFTKLMIYIALGKNASPELLGLFVSKIEKFFTVTCLRVGDGERSIGLGFEGEISLPLPSNGFGLKSIFPSGNCKVIKWEIFSVEDAVTLNYD